MGEVYKARDTRLNRTVALKILPPEFSSDPARRARFSREAQTISQLNHPHICVLHDVGEAPLPTAEPSGPSVQYLVMEYLEGQTLARRLAKGAQQGRATRARGPCPAGADASAESGWTDPVALQILPQAEGPTLAGIADPRPT